MAFYDSRFIFRYTYLTCRTKIFHCNAVQFTAYVFRNNVSTCKYSNILKHCFAAVTKSRSFYSNGFERTTQFVDNEGCQRFTFDIFSNDKKFLTSLYYFFKDRQHFLDRCNLAIRNEDIRFTHDSFHFFCIRCHVRGNIATVKLHAFYDRQLCTHRLGFFNSDDTVFTNFFHSFSNQFAYFFIACRNGSNLGNRCFIRNSDGTVLDFFNEFCYGFFNTAFKDHRVGTSSNITHPFLDHGLGKQRSRCRTITSYIICFSCYFFYQLGTHIFKRIFQFDIAGNSNTIIGNGRCAKFLIKNYIAAFRS